MTFILALLLAMATLPASARELFVSPSGSDADPGTRTAPFASLSAARDAVRSLRREGHLPDGGITVTLLEGLHTLHAPFALTPDDSGTAASPVTYRGEDGAVLFAGRRIASSAFAPVTDEATLARLVPEARDHIVQLDLLAVGAAHAGPFPDRFRDGGDLLDLFVDGRRLPLSRWPNEGYVTMQRVVDKGDWSDESPRGGTFVYEGDRPARWGVERGVWLDGFWRVPWQPEALRVQAIDPEARTMTFATPIELGIGSKYAGPQGSGKEPWYALNLLEEIDRPGEWCIDFSTKTLYLWPPGELGRADIFLCDDDTPMLALDRVSHVRIRGLTFEGRLGNGIEILDGSHVAVEGCTFRRLGGTAVLVRGGEKHTVRSCDIYDVGNGGVYVAGGDRPSLTPCGHEILNNHIHDFAHRRKTYAPGIRLGNVVLGFGPRERVYAIGIRVAHNLIHDAPHAAILYGGNDNVIENNEVYRIALDSGDVGAFYTGRDWTTRGNVIRRNFIHHSPAANAVYLDDGDSGDSVVENIFYRTASGVFIGGGHENVARNNIFIRCGKAVHIDSRGVPRGYAENATLLQTYRSVDVTRPPWSTRFPELVTFWEHRDIPTGNMVENNVSWRCDRWLRLQGEEEHFRFTFIGTNLEADPVTNPGFADPAALDFTVTSDAAIRFDLPDFVPIPISGIGLVIDEFRTELPVRAPVSELDPEGEVFDSETDLQRSNEQARPKRR